MVRRLKIIWLLKQTWRKFHWSFRVQRANTYAQTEENEFGSETTFFTIDDEENKQILGYAETQVSEGQEGHPVDGDLAVFDGLEFSAEELPKPSKVHFLR